MVHITFYRWAGLIHVSSWKRKVLWSQSGHLQTPGTLIYVPVKYRSRSNQVLLPIEIEGRITLSFQYAANDISKLIELGAIQLDQRLFLKSLKLLGIQSWQTPEWHEDVAKVLLSIPLGLIDDLPLIPLEGVQSQWVSAKEATQDPVYKKPSMGTATLPPGIDLRFVEPSATRSVERAGLFEMLGVKACDPGIICDALVHIRKSTTWKTTLETVMKQTKYMFRHRESYSSGEIKFGTTKAFLVPGCQVYFNDPRSKFRIEDLLSDWLNIKLLHPHYLEEDPSITQTEWLDWLIGKNKLSAVPRMTTPYLSPRNLSPEFKKWVQTSSIKSLVDVMTDNWRTYKDGILLAHQVLNSRLSGTILPLSDLIREKQQLLHGEGRRLLLGY